MINFIGAFREKLNSDRPALGAGITLNDPAVCEALAPLVDFLWIDLEHSPMSMETMYGHLVACRASAVPSIVRVPGCDPHFIKRVLDAGAEGIICPQIQSAAEAQLVVDACRYAPVGRRGWGPRRPSDYGERALEEVVRQGNEELFVAVQIENEKALAGLEAIVVIPGLDSLVVGPADLAFSLGHPGELRHPHVTQSIETVIQTGRRAGLYVGIGAEACVESCRHWASLGMDWIQAGCDFSYMKMTASSLFAEISATT